MPWKASSVMEERLRFVARLLDGEAMTDVCREFGVSRNERSLPARTAGTNLGFRLG
jgi:transposase-like protein